MRTEEELTAFFEKHDAEFVKFDRVKNKLSKRPDLHAFLLLDQLVPGSSDIVTAAEHDEIFLEVSQEDLAKVATDAQLIDLIRCGVRLGDDENLCMLLDGKGMPSSIFGMFGMFGCRLMALMKMEILDVENHGC